MTRPGRTYFGLTLAVLLSLAGVFAGCGGGSDDSSFAGTWTGTLTLIGNDCPFGGPPNQNQIFPVQVADQADGTVVVRSAQGRVATGQNGNDSFSVTSLNFTDALDQTRFDCLPGYEFGFYAPSGENPQADLRIIFNNCTDLVTGDTEEGCALLYNGPVTQIQ